MAEIFGLNSYDKEKEKPKPPKISRRAFLSTVGAVGTATLAGVALPGTRDKLKETFLLGQLQESINGKVLLIKQLYDIEIRSKHKGVDAKMVFNLFRKKLEEMEI